MKYNAAAAIALFFALIAFAIWVEIGVWNECRATNSWFYCMRILSK
jgi:hypothetical protein